MNLTPEQWNTIDVFRDALGEMVSTAQPTMISVVHPDGTPDQEPDDRLFSLLVDIESTLDYLLQGQNYCQHTLYGKGPHCAEMSCSNYIGKHAI